MSITLRQGCLGDVDWVLFELKKFDEFTDAPFPLVEDEDHVRGILRDMIQNHYFMIAEQIDWMTDTMVPVAFLGALYLAKHPFNPRRKYLAEQCWWSADESMRGSKGALFLLNHYTEKCAETYAAGGIATIALESQSPVNERTLQKRGFRLAERSFVYDPRGAA